MAGGGREAVSERSSTMKSSPNRSPSRNVPERRGQGRSAAGEPREPQGALCCQPESHFRSAVNPCFYVSSKLLQLWPQQKSTTVLWRGTQLRELCSGLA